MFSVGLDTSALDLAFKSHAQRGIGRYVSELRKYFDTKQDDLIKVGFFNHSSFFGGRVARPFLKMLPAGVNTIRQQVLFPFELSTGSTKEFDCVHFPAHMDAPSWSMKRCIVTVLDLIPLVLRDMYRSESGEFRYEFARWLECKAIRNAALILAISENTAQDVHRILKIPRERIVVTPLGVDERFHNARLVTPESEIRTKLGIPVDRPIILYVGGIDQRKNYAVMIETMSKLLSAQTGETPAPVLVMAGRIQGDRQYPKLLQCISSAGVKDSVILPGFVAEEDLLQLYAMSSVFFFPSLYEGFGLPPLEAMAAGLPVVSSNTSCMPEVLGEAAVSISPSDSDGAARAIHQILSDKDLAEHYRSLGRKRARQFTWERTGEATLRAYQLLAREYELAA